MHLPSFLLLACLAPVCAFAGVSPDKSPASTAPSQGPAFFENSTSLSQYFLGPDNAWDSAYDAVEKWKADNHIPITIGANHWWHVDRNERIYGDGYGVPGESGTYYYFLDFDPKMKLDPDGFAKEIGLHVEGRIRDSGNKLRGFYNDTLWTYEAYAYAKTDLGVFKVGQVAENFCIAWDNSWWEGVPYFDEYRFNPSWGVSWENTWKVSSSFSVDSALQYFVRGDRVSGAEPGASAASTRGLEERNTGLVRVVPTWKLSEDTKIALGVAGLVRGIDRGGVSGISSTQAAWDTDVTLTMGNLSIFAQYIDSNGVISPVNYVSGGPSSRQDSFETGINYKFGPVSAHVNFSRGWYHDPSGEQFIFNPGITFQVAKNLTLYTEYVKWNVRNSAGVTSRYDDGYELALVWSF
ncbi:MAG: hypothetical protein JWO94_1974 [Verrucomicrobiaceae bacterium]|nr:hypothetical protein [Verrucomicrobiaceae bacterium]